MSATSNEASCFRDEPGRPVKWRRLAHAWQRLSRPNNRPYHSRRYRGTHAPGASSRAGLLRQGEVLHHARVLVRQLVAVKHRLTVPLNEANAERDAAVDTINLWRNDKRVPDFDRNGAVVDGNELKRVHVQVERMRICRVVLDAPFFARADLQLRPARHFSVERVADRESRCPLIGPCGSRG